MYTGVAQALSSQSLMSHVLAGLSKGVLVFAIKYLNTKESRLRSRYVLKLSFPKVVIGLLRNIFHIDANVHVFRSFLF